MPLEVYSRKGRRFSDPRVTITKSGQIGLNSSCLDKYFNSKENVLLYVDKNKKKIGIKPINRPEENSFRISFSVKRTTGSISGHSFLKYCRIDFPQTKRFIPEWDSRENILTIDYR